MATQEQVSFEDKERGARRRERWLLAGSGLVVLALFLLIGPRQVIGTVGTLIRHGLPSGSFTVQSASMLPTYSSGTRIFYYRQPLHKIRRADLVIYDNPSGNGTHFFKRVVALAGDTVVVRDEQLLVNGEPIDEPYIKEPMRYSFLERQIGPEQLFVLGDNRNNSADSHIHGPISGEIIVGVVK
jgi:signal peptidase I